MVAIQVNNLQSYLLLRHLPDHKHQSSCYLVSWIQDLESNSQFLLFHWENTCKIRTISKLRQIWSLRNTSSRIILCVCSVTTDTTFIIEQLFTIYSSTIKI